MKKIWLLLTIVFLGCSKAQLPLTPELNTILEIIAINPDGESIDSAKVFIDGTMVGITPYKKDNIQTGVHALRLTKERFQVFTDQLTIEEGQFYSIEAVLNPIPPNVGELLITTNQDSALVIVKDSNDNVIVQTYERASSHVLPAGAYIVTGEKANWPKIVKAVEVAAGQTTTVNLVLSDPNYEPPTLIFSIAQDTVKLGEACTLNWQSNGYQVIIDQGVGVRGPNGSEKVVCPTPGLKIFTATAYSLENLTTEKKDTVFIASNSGNPPDLEFSVLPDSVVSGDPVSIEWRSNGYQVVIDQGVGIRGPTGAEEVYFINPGKKVFTAIAYGENNLTTEKKDSVYITPISMYPPNLEFSVVPDSVVFGEFVFIQWQSDGYQVVIDQGVGTRGPTGSEEVNFKNPGRKVFTATAYGEDNLLTIKQDSVFIKEAPQPILPVIMLSTTKLVQVNSPATIYWQSQNADYVVVDYVSNANLQGKVEINFSTPGIRIVTATAFNQAGYTSSTDTIEVVEPAVVSVDDIIVSAQSSVRADKGESGYVDMNAASFEIEISGQYRIFAEVWYNSGDSQLNESFYLEIRDESNKTIFPQDANAGIHYVVPDEPGEPHTASRASGVFKLSAGMHFIDMYHYAKIAGIYPQFVNATIDGPESVYIVGFKIVYVGD